MHKPILSTGASSGIGEACAVHLAHKGFTVFAAARRLDVLNDLSGLGGGRIHPVQMDVTSSTSISEALGQIAEHTSTPLFGLINNAGVSVMGPVERVDIDEWKRLYETNVFGLVQVTQAVLPQMREEGLGRIINIGSVAGRIVMPFFSPYASSKHAVEGISDGLRRECEPLGIRVSHIRPGFINTQFGVQEHKSLEPHMQEGEPYSDAVQKFNAWHERGHPNASPPSEVAEVVYHALTASKPHSRYTVPKKYMGYLALRNTLPSAVVDRILARTIAKG